MTEREIGYAEALAELEVILDELDGDEVDAGRPSCCACAATGSRAPASTSSRSWPSSRPRRRR
jgi:hypothetical protein